VAVILLVTGTLTVPSAGAASVEGGNAFNELSRKAQEPTTPTTTTTATTGTTAEAKNSNSVIFIGLGAAVALLVGIGFVIVRDARRVAPAGAEDTVEGGSGRDMAARHRRRRAKAKAARAQRKKNR
jgi:hypothetical protein